MATQITLIMQLFHTSPKFFKEESKKTYSIILAMICTRNKNKFELQIFWGYK